MTTTVTEAHNAFAGQGAVLLDIGGDVGALVVAMPAATVGLEVEIRPLVPGNVRAHAHTRDDHVHPHAHGHLAHVAAVPRPVGDGYLPSLVFGELEAGGYELFEKGRPDRVALRVDVTGGEVTAASWPEPV